MKNPILALACAAALSISLAASAQQGAAAPGTVDNAALAKIRDSIRTDRKGLVARNLALTDDEAKAFWPVYEKCRDSMENAHRKVNRAILDYVNAESKMTDAHAKQIVGEALAGESDEARARKNCFDKVAKVLPGKKAARYFQIETKISALSHFDAAIALPLVQ
jgi:Spy/CpxP family protein refolding chaperone